MSGWGWRQTGAAGVTLPAAPYVRGLLHQLRDFCIKSGFFTKASGNVVWMGCNGATLDNAPGDVVEMEIPGIGTLGNRITTK